MAHYLSCMQIVSLYLILLKRRRTIRRGTLSFLADSLLESGEGSCLPAFVLNTFNAAQKSFIGLREAMQGRLAPWGTNLICYCRKSRVLFAMWALARYICP